MRCGHPSSSTATSLVVSVSIGVAQRRPDTGDAAELLRRADFAMYMAKGGGKGRYQLFDAQVHDDMVGRAAGSPGWHVDRAWCDRRSVSRATSRASVPTRRSHFVPEAAVQVQSVAPGLARSGVADVGVQGMVVVGGLERAV